TIPVQKLPGIASGIVRAHTDFRVPYEPSQSPQSWKQFLSKNYQELLPGLYGLIWILSFKKGEL
ncbi:MAG: hypothetical protein OSJ38_04470, partial [Lachnospiraceae bacterium]|nr:hypothetical protein [Lachnospiraceae bacterium]